MTILPQPGRIVPKSLRNRLTSIGVIVTLALVTGCASGSTPVVTAPRIASGDSLVRGLTIGNYRLGQIGTIEGYPLDTIFRFTDGSSASISAIRFPIPDDVRFGSQSDRWSRREGAKFLAIQEFFVSQKRITGFRVVIDSGHVVAVDRDSIFEHALAIEVRSNNATRMDLQYIYEVCDRFLKIRGTFPGTTWPREEFAHFAREVMRLTRDAELRAHAGGAPCPRLR